MMFRPRRWLADFEQAGMIYTVLAQHFGELEGDLKIPADEFTTMFQAACNGAKVKPGTVRRIALMPPEQRRTDLQRALDRIRATETQRESYTAIADLFDMPGAGHITEAIRTS